MRKSVVAIAPVSHHAQVRADVRAIAGADWGFDREASPDGTAPATHRYLHTIMTDAEIADLAAHPDCQVVSYNTTDEHGNIVFGVDHVAICLTAWGLVSVEGEALF